MYLGRERQYAFLIVSSANSLLADKVDFNLLHALRYIQRCDWDENTALWQSGSGSRPELFAIGGDQQAAMGGTAYSHLQVLHAFNWREGQALRDAELELAFAKDLHVLASRWQLPTQVASDQGCDFSAFTV
ncbi:hypothetical protein D3C81_1885020 [compost metagenome]